MYKEIDMKQFFYLISEIKGNIVIKIFTTETKVLYAQSTCDSYETAQQYGTAFCDSNLSFIEGSKSFNKLFPGDK